MGIELSVPLAWKERGGLPLISGPILQWQHQPHGERLMLGLEAAKILGGEVGLAMRFPKDDDFQLGAHAALFLSAVALNIGPRIVQWRDGTEIGLVFSVKAPARIAGKAPWRMGHGRPWRGQQSAALTLKFSAPRAGPRTQLAPAHLAIARCWLRDAVGEQLSVASFALLARDLQARYAPAALIARARRAAFEETGHARRCLHVLEGLTGVRVRSAIALSAPESEPKSLTDIAVESALDGVHGEGLAAEDLRTAADGALPAVRRHLVAIARDEHGHAELARDIVDWASASGARVRRAVRDAADADLRGPRSFEPAQGLMRCWGRARLPV